MKLKLALGLACVLTAGIWISGRRSDPAQPVHIFASGGGGEHGTGPAETSFSPSASDPKGMRADPISGQVPQAPAQAKGGSASVSSAPARSASSRAGRLSAAPVPIFHPVTATTSAQGPTSISHAASAPVSTTQEGVVEIVEEPTTPLALRTDVLQNFELSPPGLAAIARAQEMFQKGVAASPSKDPNSEAYFNTWQGAAQRSDGFLRAMLGWSAFNTLSAEAARITYEQLATAKRAGAGQ